MVRLQETNGRFFLTIPKEYVEEKGWTKGQTLVLGFDSSGNIIIKDIKNSGGNKK
jgi:hypothetical protein